MHQFQRLEDWVTRIVNETGKHGILDLTVNTLRYTLGATGHVPTASSVARGAGYCSYWARLVEAIGAARVGDVVMERIGGKGSDVHRLLGMAVLRALKDWKERRPSKDLHRYVKESATELNIKEGAVETASKLLEILFHRALPRAMELLGVDMLKLFPVVEQQLIDYDIHIRGSPDLILEDRTNKKAVVIEWKTTPRTSTGWEKAQVLIYTLLAARRLGYTREELIDVVLGSEPDGRDAKVLPIIVRPTKKRGELEPHPALAPEDKTEDKKGKRYEEVKKLLMNILIEAEHLTVLLTNQERLAGVSHEALMVPWKGVEVNVLRLTPEQLPRGVPRRLSQEDSRWKRPCVLRNRRTGEIVHKCDMAVPCRFYFARPIGQRENYERRLWRLRYKVYDEMEERLLVYRALYEAFKQHKDVVGRIKQGYGILFRADPVPNVQTGSEWRGRIMVEIKDHVNVKKRVDVLDELRYDDEGGIFIGKRTLRHFEKDVPYVIDEKPVLITPVEAGNPLLSIGLFGRVEDVRLEGNDVIYEIGVPSRFLEYQAKLFKEYIQRWKLDTRDTLIVEVDVDLTHMELRALDALQRMLAEAREEKQLEEEEYRTLNDVVVEARRAVGEVEEETLTSMLRRLLNS